MTYHIPARLYIVGLRETVNSCHRVRIERREPKVRDSRLSMRSTKGRRLFYLNIDLFRLGFFFFG